MGKSFQRVQSQFTQRIRCGSEAVLPDDVNKERMQVYQDLLFNNVSEVFKRCFPVLSELLPERKSHELLADFLRYKHCVTPYFYHLPREMLEFFQTVKMEQYPFLTQLAHYEWLELELEISDEGVAKNYSSEFELSSVFVLSPLIRVHAYEYEVEKIAKQYQPQDKKSSYLLLYRDKAFRVMFFKLNRQSYELIQLLIQGCTLEQTIKRLITLFPEINPQQLITGSIEILERWKDERIVLGAHRAGLIIPGSPQ